MHIELPASLTGDGVALRRLRAATPAPTRRRSRTIRARPADRDREDPDEARVRDRATADRRFELAIADEDDAFAGMVLLHSLDERHRHCEVGFWLVPAARGNGVGDAARCGSSSRGRSRSSTCCASR